MGSMLVRWTLCAGLGSILLLAPLSLPLAVSNPSVVYAADKSDLLDINTATVDQPNALPGIGDAYSEKIIQGRPNTRKDELVQKRIRPRATYGQIKYKVVTKQK